VFYFLYPFKDVSIVFNLFRYITFRAAIASVTAFLLCLWIGPWIIRWLVTVKVTANQEREYAKPIHDFFKHKKNVPTMGGIIIVASVTATMLLWGNLTNRYVWLLLLSTLGFAAVGFWDDWSKLRSQSSRGLSSRKKFAGQLVMAAVVGVFLYFDGDFEKCLYFPFLKQGGIALGIFSIPVILLVLVGSSNALNLTDGLDGLAIGCTLFASGALAVMAYVSGRVDYAAYLSIPHVPDAGEVTVFAAAIMGASAGFLWFNSFPAEVMMGDTGSLALGGALGTISVLIKKETVLIIIGGVFVWEALSVIMQVASFKMFRKRIFLMSPFHHHLQLKGWPESKVTVRLWIIAMILALVGLSTLKIR
jgi:phospho-N-acetylmuramoyl-pentapeptide-transferase